MTWLLSLFCSLLTTHYPSYSLPQQVCPLPARNRRRVWAGWGTPPPSSKGVGRVELGCSTILYGGHSLDDALAGIEKAGYKAIELCAILGMADHIPVGQPAS